VHMICICFTILHRKTAAIACSHTMNHLSFTEFEPNSPTIRSAGLVSPEAMVLQGNRILYQFDATWNMVKFGFTDSRQCGDDQGETFSNVSFRDCNLCLYLVLLSRGNCSHCVATCDCDSGETM